jgi:hypothetical protein
MWLYTLIVTYNMMYCFQQLVQMMDLLLVSQSLVTASSDIGFSISALEVVSSCRRSCRSLMSLHNALALYTTSRAMTGTIDSVATKTLQSLRAP